MLSSGEQNKKGTEGHVEWDAKQETTPTENDNQAKEAAPEAKS
jgi:hypothetical protein